MNARPGLAVFDFDGTITTRDSLLGFLLRVSGPIPLVKAAIAERKEFLAARRDDTRRDGAKAALFARVLTGLDGTEVAQQGVAYGHWLVEHLLRDDTRTRIEWHRTQGHELAIVSASLEDYLATVCDRLGIEHLASTRLERAADGTLTGVMLGANCRRAEKVRRLEGICDLDGREIWAYGDSPGDTELLARADHAIWV